MKQKILAQLKIGESIFSRHLDLPIDPEIGMQLELTCEDSDRGVFAVLNLRIVDLIYLEKEKSLICNMKYFHDDEKFVTSACLEADNWGMTLLPNS